jgi:hypothetical protein
MPKPFVLIAVGTLLVSIGFAIPGVFPGIIFCVTGLLLLGLGSLLLPELR